jgi:two-component system phosphate regulon sensor histidine kinase PhoR
VRRPYTLSGRLFLWQLSVVVAVLAVVGLALDRTLERQALDDITASLVRQAGTVQQALPADDADLQTEVLALGRASDVRITVIRTDGVVLADSEHDPTTMENHLDRPEVQQALAGSVGTSSRISATIGAPFRYVALPPVGDRIVRVAFPLTRVTQRRDTVRTTVLLGLLAAAILASLGALLVGRAVTRPLRRATESMARLGEGDLSVRVDPAGPREFAVLAATLNLMAERLEAQVAASDEERRSRDLILSSMEEGVLLGAPNGTVRFVNRAMERHLGTSPATLSMLAPVGLREVVRRASEARSPMAVDVEVGASSRSLRGAAVPVDDDGSVLLVLHDVTEAKRLDAVRRDFVANASHELKTPAAAIQATAETLRTAAVEDPGVVPRFAEQLEREAARLSRIVSDLLDLSRLESGSETQGTVRLDDLLGEERERLEAAARDGDVALRFDVAPVPPVRGSARDLSLLVRNLVDNAVRYTKAGGRVDVQLGMTEADVRLLVTDTGLGIPSRDLPRIFERFYRVDRARSRETGGTGLGLSIVKHVVENHGGTVSVRSELGRGTTFEVRLPAAV